MKLYCYVHEYEKEEYTKYYIYNSNSTYSIGQGEKMDQTNYDGSSQILLSPLHHLYPPPYKRINCHKCFPSEKIAIFSLPHSCYLKEAASILQHPTSTSTDTKNSGSQHRFFN